MAFFICAFLLFFVVFLVANSYPDNTLNYEYDSIGRLNCIESRSNRECYQYDPQGNLLSKSNEGNLNGKYKPIEVSSSYDAYGGVQGNQNWYYQEWNGTSYKDMSYKKGQWLGSSPVTLFIKEAMHPDETDAVRKWVAPKSGLVRIAGNVAMYDAVGGDGVNVKIMKNNIQLWSKKLNYNDSTGYEVGLTVAVNAGDSIYFLVNKNGTNLCDATRWNSVIGYLDAR
ncbi:hypothetical protein [Paenibacillus sp. HW567]|uniref:hypothetical protein n=1 Tax=Paenibacillus sp. HW567 TaxID=1034769 RepID=UPI0018DDA3FD|nr:hypothetical protein [Paenibacillus sp. HW567]